MKCLPFRFNKAFRSSSDADSVVGWVGVRGREEEEGGRREGEGGREKEGGRRREGKRWEGKEEGP